MTSNELPPDLGGANAVKVVADAMDRMRKFQRSPEGIKARKRWEQEQVQKQRDARQELCDLRGIPDDFEVRRWALDPHPTGPLFKAISEAIRFKLDRQKELGGVVPVMRFLVGSPGTGKSSALAWAVAEWEQPALFTTADVLCRSKDETLWRDVARVSLLVIDELGIEPTADRITELMLQRWQRGKLTLCGTNLTAKELMDRYMTGAGARLLDRLAHQKANGLAAQVKAIGPSYRGVKTTRPEDF